ncbi:hypothetical protein GCM10027277_25760 [Pseudoduganella ginsengisoli]
MEEGGVSTSPRSGGIMGKKPLIVIVIILLAAVVGFLAADRQDKMNARDRDKAFDARFAK